jgi:hypothetical protein
LSSLLLRRTSRGTETQPRSEVQDSVPSTYYLLTVSESKEEIEEFLEKTTKGDGDLGAVVIKLP